MVPRDPGSLDFAASDRAVVTLSMRGTTTQWIAPFELLSDNANGSIRGRLPGYPDPGDARLTADPNPVRDFRGWLWQTGICADGSDAATCTKRGFFSIRLPVD